MIGAVSRFAVGVLEGILGNMVTDGRKTESPEPGEVWEMENGRIVAIVLDGVRFVKEKTTHLRIMRGLLSRPFDYYRCEECKAYIVGYYEKDVLEAMSKPRFCTHCGARVVDR